MFLFLEHDSGLQPSNNMGFGRKLQLSLLQCLLKIMEFMPFLEQVVKQGLCVSKREIYNMKIAKAKILLKREMPDCNQLAVEDIMQLQQNILDKHSTNKK